MSTPSEVERLSFFSRLPEFFQTALLRELAGADQARWIAPEIIDPNTQEGEARLKELEQEAEKVVKEPFLAAAAEFIGLRSYYQKQLEVLGLTEHSDELEIAAAYKNLFITRVQDFATQKKTDEKKAEISPLELQNLVDESIIFKDLAQQIKELLAVNVEDGLSEQARFIWDTNNKRLSLYVSEKIDVILKRTRMLGLIPFEALDALREQKIVVLGASVSASTVDLLGALGAKYIDVIDDGKLDPSNSPRMPAGVTADYSSSGTAKVDALAENMYGRNPYGSFRFRQGRAVLNADEKRADTEDATFNELITSETDLVIEVVDSAKIKMQIRLWMEEKFPDTPILYMADTGNEPFVVFEKPGEGKHFNQELSSSQLDFLRKIATSPNSPQERLTALFMMVKGDLPNDHTMQVLTGLFGGIVPYLSQIPSAARLSSAIAVSELLMELQEKGSPGVTLTQKDAPTTLVPVPSELAQQTLRQIFDSTIT